MLKKLFLVSLILAGIVTAYIVMLATQGATNSIIASVNSTLVATSNMTNYPGTQAFIESFPLWQWFIPAIVGLVAIVVVLKTK